MEKLQQINSLGFTKVEHHDLSQPILELQGVSIQFNGTLALDNIGFKLHKGERVAIIGPNGAGKSTLFNIISGVLSPNRGQVNIYGNQPGEHICIAYVPQRSQVDWKFPVNVADVVLMGRVRRMGLFRWPKRHDWQLVHEAERNLLCTSDGRSTRADEAIEDRVDEGFIFQVANLAT